MTSDSEIALAFLCMLVVHSLPVYWVVKWLKRKKKEFIWNLEVSDKIEELSYINRQAKMCDELMTDINLSNPNKLQGMTLKWNSGAGVSKELDLYADGESEVTEELRRLAGERLTELTSSLSGKFDDLNKRTYGNGNGYGNGNDFRRGDMNERG